jgi:peptidyl-prolyl cis-trans isomerase SurA
LKDNIEVKAAIAAIALAALFAASPALAATFNRVVAVVNNDVITQAQLDRATSLQGRAGAKGAPPPVSREEALDRLINDRLLNQLLLSSKIEVTEDDLVRAIGNVLSQNGMTLEQLKAELNSKGMSYEEYKKEVEGEIRRVKFVNQTIGSQVKISDQDLRDYYQRHPERFRGGVSAHIAQIFLPFGNITTEAEALRFKEQAMAIAAKARKGGSFAELAKQNSKGPNAENGGDMGTLNLKNLDPNVADAVRALKVGEVSPPIPTEQGLVIVKLVSLPELASGDFDALRDRIYSAVYDERIQGAMQSFLQKERQKAFIEIR